MTTENQTDTATINPDALCECGHSWEHHHNEGGACGMLNTVGADDCRQFRLAGTEQPTTTINPDAPRPGPYRVGAHDNYSEYEYMVYDANGDDAADCRFYRIHNSIKEDLEESAIFARRVAAALNYCAGISTEALERSPTGPVDTRAIIARINQRHKAEVLEAYTAGARRGQAACEATHQCEVCEDRQRVTDAVTASALRLDSSPPAASESDFDSEKVGQHGLEQENGSQREFEGKSGAGRITVLGEGVLPFGSPAIGSESVASRLAAIERQIELNTKDIGWLAERLDGLGLGDLEQQMSAVLGRLDLIEQLPIIIEGRKH